MGNDILSVFIERKKRTTIRSSLLFVKYLVDNKAKLNKTMEKIVSIYYRDFYLQQDIDFKELGTYFSLDNFKDELFKMSLLSSIRFYKESGIEEKIVTDIRTIVFLSNALFLALALGIAIDKNYEKDYQSWLEIFLRKYQNKLRILDENEKKDFEQELNLLVKKEENAYRRFFKLLEESQYQVTLEPLLDFSNGYLVKGSYEIKMLSRYSIKEVAQVYQKKEFYLDQFLITLERLSVSFLKQILAGRELPKYFLFTPIEIVEKDVFSEVLDAITKNPIFRSSLVLVFTHRELIHHVRTEKALIQEGFQLGIKDLDEASVKPDSFEYVRYVFTTPEFLESHSRNYSLWEDKDIRFIIWEGDHHE